LPVSRADLTGLIIVYAGTLFTSLEEGVRKPGESKIGGGLSAPSVSRMPPRPALVATGRQCAFSSLGRRTL
jgi:hypothetical protein